MAWLTQAFAWLLFLSVVAAAPGRQQVGPGAGPNTAADSKGLVIDPATYKVNLQQVRDNVIPRGWQLNPVAKWDAYGHGIRNLAGVAAQLGMPVSVLTNKEAAEAITAARAVGVAKPVVRRIMPYEGPARSSEILAAAKQPLGIEELMASANKKDIEAAAAATGRAISVHIYLYNHYWNNFGFNFTTAQQLQELVDSLNPKLVTVKGIMMHTGGDKPGKAAALVNQFNKVVCPVAQKLGTPAQPVYLHFASSSDVDRLLPKGGGGRMVPPADLCKGPGIMWAARIGSITYGSDLDDNKATNTRSVLKWTERVAAVKPTKQPDGSVRMLAQVPVTPPAKYPAPSWWPGVQAFIPESVSNSNGATSAAINAPAPGAGASAANDGPAAGNRKLLAPVSGYQPDSYVRINGQRFRLAAIPRDGSQLLVDVSKAKKPVSVGNAVCIVCQEQPLGSLSEEVGTDSYNLALCLMGKKPVRGHSGLSMPQCSV